MECFDFVKIALCEALSCSFDLYMNRNPVALSYFTFCYPFIILRHSMCTILDLDNIVLNK